MRQKIRFDRKIKAGVITALESSEVDPGVMMPLHEEEYDLEELVGAYKEGVDAFGVVLRRRTFFPPTDLVRKLYEETAEFFKSDDMEKIVIEYSDIEFFPDDEEFHLEDDDVELDALLDEDGDTKEDEMKEIDSEDDTPQFKPEDISEHEN
ncbi:MAG: hypothetical protein MI747_03655 [Desulfobacterales bacterium]|nr:hypothetical protein [Desulfobacterales bacterium]